MTDSNNFPVSDMARRSVERSVGKIMEVEDVAEQARMLMLSGISAGDLTEITGLSIAETLSSAFNAGISYAIHALMDAGLTTEQLPIEQLTENARAAELKFFTTMEESAVLRGLPIGSLYPPEDAGSGEPFNA
ncbi:MAG: hypothetical protein JWO47_465 [Candidatus Saccharibacteria bacterium]|nr:hypothetical protein [Candidatus Saccharibacteria bacterium]